MGDAAEAADQVDLDRELELLHRIGRRGLGFLVAADCLRRVGDAGAIDQDAFLAVRVARLGEGLRRPSRPTSRRPRRTSPPISLATFSPRSCVPVEDRDLRPAPRELPRRRLAEARCGAGHDRGHSIDVHFSPQSA